MVLIVHNIDDIEKSLIEVGYINGVETLKEKFIKKIAIKLNKKRFFLHVLKINIWKNLTRYIQNNTLPLK